MAPLPQAHASLPTSPADEAETEEEDRKGAGVEESSSPLPPPIMVWDIRNRSSSRSEEKIGASLPAIPRRMYSSTSCGEPFGTSVQGCGGREEEVGEAMAFRPVATRCSEKEEALPTGETDVGRHAKEEEEEETSSVEERGETSV